MGPAHDTELADVATIATWLGPDSDYVTLMQRFVAMRKLHILK